MRGKGLRDPKSRKKFGIFTIFGIQDFYADLWSDLGFSRSGLLSSGILRSGKVRGALSSSPEEDIVVNILNYKGC